MGAIVVPEVLKDLDDVKIDATTAPGVSNDNTEGYSPGSIWVDVTNDKSYTCLDASTGAAIWAETTGVGDIDGGAFSDTFINTADIDGGPF